MKEFNKIIKKGLKKENISLRELSRRANIDVSFLSKILNGKRNPPRKESDLRKIAESLNIVPELLILSAGRVPKNLYRFFVNKRLVKFLIKAESPKKLIAELSNSKEDANLNSVKKQYLSKDIEDELL